MKILRFHIEYMYTVLTVVVVNMLWQVDGRGRRLDLGPANSSLTPLDQGTATSGRSTLPSNPSDDDADRNLAVAMLV